MEWVVMLLLGFTAGLITFFWEIDDLGRSGIIFFSGAATQACITRFHLPALSFLLAVLGFYLALGLVRRLKASESLKSKEQKS